MSVGEGLDPPLRYHRTFLQPTDNSVVEGSPLRETPSTFVEGHCSLFLPPIVAAVSDGYLQDLLLEFPGELIGGDTPASGGTSGPWSALPWRYCRTIPPESHCRGCRCRPRSFRCNCGADSRRRSLYLVPARFSSTQRKRSMPGPFSQWPFLAVSSPQGME